jgi:hypothetical protein
MTDWKIWSDRSIKSGIKNVKKERNLGKNLKHESPAGGR